MSQGSDISVVIYHQRFHVDKEAHYIYIGLAIPTGENPMWAKTYDQESGWEFLHEKIRNSGGTGTLELWDVRNKDKPRVRKLLGCIMVNPDTKEAITYT